MPYLFNDERFEAHASREQRRLSQQITRYWTNFARSGDPNGTGLPSSAPFDSRRAGSLRAVLAPGTNGIGPVDYAAEHQLDFWAER